MIAPASLLLLTITGGPDVPDCILAAVAYRETASIWRGRLVHPGIASHGSDVSAWQISPAVLSDLHADRQRAMRDPVYAEGLARRWLAHLYAACGSWKRALAAYHAGLRKADTAPGRQYAEECLNLAALYTP